MTWQKRKFSKPLKRRWEILHQKNTKQNFSSSLTTNKQHPQMIDIVTSTKPCAGKMSLSDRGSMKYVLARITLVAIVAGLFGFRCASTCDVFFPRMPLLICMHAFTPVAEFFYDERHGPWPVFPP